MEKKYLDEFIDSINNTVIEARSGGSFDYDQGMQRLVEYFHKVKKDKKGLFICGNGGSSGIAIHMTADFLKNGGFKVRSLMNASILTCIGNDLNYEYIFCKQLELMAAEGDVLIAISSSGNSENIIKSVETMRAIGGSVITFSGFDADNRLKKMGDFNVYVPISHYGIVESIHNMMLQQIVDEIVERDGIALTQE